MVTLTVTAAIVNLMSVSQNEVYYFPVMDTSFQKSGVNKIFLFTLIKQGLIKLIKNDSEGC